MREKKTDPCVGLPFDRVVGPSAAAKRECGPDGPEENGKRRIRLVRPSHADAARIDEYRSAFRSGGMRVTWKPGRIPGMDGLEDFESVSAWLRHCDSMRGRIDWYMSVRAGDGKIVGFCCLRRRLCEDDDDPEFASHIGYSVRPDERGQGYGREQLRLLLPEARKAGIGTVRIVCRDINAASNRTILANGGVFIDSIYGEESGMTVNRYDIRTD